MNINLKKNISDIVIKATNLSKIYKLYNKPKDLLVEFLTGKKKHTEIHALKDLNFEIKKGEVVGVIGSNGAGKSTLLKILTGTLNKSSGNLEVNGKISAILELGTGFHPEYTGRENIIMGAMCLGMSKEKALSKVDSIIEFSELGDVIDNQFHTYSSGMQARLTFSTAISVEPELFIVDEALAAGDAYFVQKCTSKIKSICDSGATVLFVSHSTYQVISLCERAIWIEDGKIIDIGNSKDVCRRYEYTTHIKSSQSKGKIRYTERDNNDEKKSNLEKNLNKKNSNIVIEGCNILHNEYYTKEKLNITKISFLGEDGQILTKIRTHDTFQINVAYQCEDQELIMNKPLGLAIGIFRESDGIMISQFSNSNPKSDEELYNNDHKGLGGFIKKKGLITALFTPNQLMHGDYIFSIGLLPGIPGNNEFYELHYKRFKISVLRSGYPSGAIFYPRVEWKHKEDK
jgi:lipopolysaccharide transport system ATP-binding protein